MKDALLPFFTHRYDMTEAEAEGVALALANDPALRTWLRDQLEMEDLIARALQPERADFANRVHAALDRGRDSERFVARVRDLVTTTSNTNRNRTASQRSKGPARQPSSSPAISFSPWGLAAAASIAVLLTAVVVWSTRPSDQHQVLHGDIVVGDASVRDIPDGSHFTVTGDEPAIVSLNSGSQAEFSPASTASIRSAPHASAQVVQLDAGSGDFRLGKGAQELQVETALGTITGSGKDGAFTATFAEEPGPGASPMPAGAHGTSTGSPQNGVLTVTVHTGSAHIDVKGKRQVILADEARVFSMVGGTLTDERSLHGMLKSLNPSGPVASISVFDHAAGLISIPLGPNTQVRINGVDATPSDLKLGEHVEVRVAREPGSPARLILAKSPSSKKPEPSHPTPPAITAPH